MAWFTFSALTRLTLARADALNTIFTAILNGFKKMGTDETQFTGHRWFYAADTGAANAYVVTLDPVPTGYVNGMTIDMNAANPNTGASTINVNGLGAKSIVDAGGVALTGGAIPSGRVSTLKYDGTQFRLQANVTTVTPADGSVTTAKLATLTNIPMANGGTISFNSGNFTFTHVAGTMALFGGSTGALTMNDGTVLYQIAKFGSSQVVIGTTSNHPVVMGANNTTIQTWSGTQTTIAKPIDISNAAAGQIAFPATQNPSAGANTFDDYEEGTYTPTSLGGSTAGAGTYTTQVGTYTKLGRAVICVTEVGWSAHTGTGNLLIGGFPFTVNGNTMLVLLGDNLTFSNALGPLFLASGGTQGSVVNHATGAAFANVAMDTSCVVRCSGAYNT